MNRRELIKNELLVLRCQQGEAAAFEQLVERWQQPLWRHAWRLTSDENAAWDVLQEVWIGIARGLDRLEDPAAFAAWAYRIVGYKCRDWIRRETRRRRADETYGEQVQQRQREAADAQRPHESLREALQRLPGRDRAILSLRYQEGFDTAEIAEILDIAVGTVKSRLFYARKRLRKFLEEPIDE